MMIEKTNFSILCLLTGVVHLIFRFSGYLNHWQEDREEKESTFVSNIINALLMLLTMFFISRADQEILHLCLILLSIALFLVNTVRLLEKKRLIFGIYVGVKFTILLWVILSSYQMPSMASSIGGLMLAAVGIALGFYKNYRSLRIYGLVLSMFSVVKLLLIDISYTNPLGRAAGFFVCGLLCFAISVLYNKLDRWIS
jgi:apolipoprotein N-acyltransferase